MKRWRTFVLVVVVLFGAALGSTYLAVRNMKQANRQMWMAWPYYRASLLEHLQTNRWDQEMVSDEDVPVLRERMKSVQGATEEETVLNLVAWINREFTANEVQSVRALDILEAKSAACEVHAFAVGVLSAFGIRARWISGVKMSPGFGLLEAFVEGNWKLFKLRDPEQIALGVSALELFHTSEPDMSVRSFYPMPDLPLQGYRGPVSVVLFPLANLERHAEIKPLFESDKGIGVYVPSFDPHQFFYAWFPNADTGWVAEGSTRREFDLRYVSWRADRTRGLELGPLRFIVRIPKMPIPARIEVSVALR